MSTAAGGAIIGPAPHGDSIAVLLSAGEVQCSACGARSAGDQHDQMAWSLTHPAACPTIVSGDLMQFVYAGDATNPTVFRIVDEPVVNDDGTITVRLG